MTSDIVDLTASNSSTQTIDFRQTMVTNDAIPDELIDDAVEVKVNSLFLKASSNSITTASSVSSSNIATYLFPTSNKTVSITFSTQSISTATRTAYQSTVGSDTYIRTYVTVTGLNSGVMTQFEVQL